MQILVTNKCAHPCKLCHFSCSEKGIELGTDFISDIIRQGQELGLKHIILNGGEPMEHTGFRTLLEISKGLDITIITNGWHFRKYHADLLKYRCSLYFALDGMDENTHDQIRGKGSYRRVMPAIIEAKKSGLKTSINFVVTNKNFMQLDKLIGFAKNEKIDYMQIINIKHDGFAKNTVLDLTENQELTVEKYLRSVKGLVFGSPYLYDELPCQCNQLQQQFVNIDWNGNLNLCSISNQLMLPPVSLYSYNLEEGLRHIKKISDNLMKLKQDTNTGDCDDCLGLMSNKYREIYNIKCDQTNPENCQICIYHKRKTCLMPISC